MKSDQERQHARELTFARDGYQCVICLKTTPKGAILDAHHLIERRLWQDGGYHLDNLVTLCQDCHISAEKGHYLLAELRAAANIGKIIVPNDMYDDVEYDKWGNVILDLLEMKISRGPFMDAELEKFLTDAGWTVSPYVKYPRTYHLPWSNPNRDDKSLSSLYYVQNFHEKDAVVTEKLDGECTTMYNDHIHARAINGSSHPSQGWVRNLHGKIAHDIPKGMRICGENLYARHSIKYEDLETYFYVFSIWDGLTCLSWDDTVEWCELLGLMPVHVIYRGVLDLSISLKLKELPTGDEREGYVIRNAGSFEYKDFKQNVAKYVRPNHVQTHERWKTNWEKNELVK